MVVGGGPVAARRARALVEAGARVEVVAPWACEDVWSLHDAGLVRMVAREYEHGDLAGSWLVHAATGDPAVDGRVADDAAEALIWCVRADDAAASRAWTPAVARHEDVVVSVNAAATRAAPLRCATRSRSCSTSASCRCAEPGGRVAATSPSSAVAPATRAWSPPAADGCWRRPTSSWSTASPRGRCSTGWPTTSRSSTPGSPRAPTP